MALSGSFIHNIKTGYRLVVEWSATQSISNNTSTITAKLYLESTGSGYNISSSTDKTAWIEIDGARSTNNSTNVTLSGNQKKLMHTYVRTVSHNSTGEKTFTLRASQEFGFTFAGSYTGTVVTGTYSYTLDTIPRSSTISSFPNFSIGGSVDITIARASTSFTHTLKIYQGTTYIGQRTGIATGTTITLSTAEQDKIYQKIPSSTSATVTLYCYTYDNGSQIGDRTSRNATATVPASIVPTFDTVTHSEFVSSIANNFTNYIQSKSRLSLNVTGASGAKYSTISSYRIRLDGNDYNSKSTTTSTITSSGNLTITATVTDSRGRTASKNVTVSVLQYEPPEIQSFQVQRCNADGTLNNDGDHAKVSGSGNYASLSGENSGLLSILSKERSESNYTPKESNSLLATFVFSYVLSLYDPTVSYDFRANLSDTFGSVFSETVLATSQVLLDLAKVGIGIGKYWERGALDVEGDFFLTGNVMGGDPVSRFDFYSNTNSSNSLTWMEMWQNADAAGNPAPTDRIGEYVFGANHFVWRTGSTDTAPGLAKMRLDSEALKPEKAFIGNPEGNNGVLNTNGLVYLENAGTLTGDANVRYIATNGRLAPVGSSRKLKKDIRTYNEDTILKVNPVLYKSKNLSEDDRDWLGLIAEEVADLGLEVLIERDEEGNPSTVTYSRIAIALIPILKKLSCDVEELKLKLKSYEEKGSV